MRAADTCATQCLFRPMTLADRAAMSHIPFRAIDDGLRLALAFAQMDFSFVHKRLVASCPWRMHLQCIHADMLAHRGRDRARAHRSGVGPAAQYATMGAGSHRHMAHIHPQLRSRVGIILGDSVRPRLNTGRFRASHISEARRPRSLGTRLAYAQGRCARARPLSPYAHRGGRGEGDD